MFPASQRLAIGFSWIGHAYMHILAALYLTIVISLERDWGLTYDDLIRLWTLGALLIGLGAPLAGWLADRWSDAKMMVAFFLLTGSGAILSGLASDTVGLTIALAILGLGASIYHPVGMSWLVKNAVNRGRALGYLGIFGSVGIASAALIAGALSQWWGWRAAFIVPGAVCVITGALLAACITMGLVRDRRGDVRPERPPSRGDVIRAFFVLSVTMLCVGVIFNATLTAMPKWFGQRMTDLTGDGTLGIGGLVTLVYLFASGSQLLGGYLADRFPLKRVYVLALLVQVPLLLVAAGLAGLPLLVVATAMVFAGSLQIPAENLLLARYTPDRHRGVAFGAKFVLSFGAAPLAVQIVAMIYGRHADFYWLFIGCGILALGAFLASLLLPKDRTRDDTPAMPVTSPLPHAGVIGPAE